MLHTVRLEIPNRNREILHAPYIDIPAGELPDIEPEPHELLALTLLPWDEGQELLDRKFTDLVLDGLDIDVDADGTVIELPTPTAPTYTTAGRCAA